MERAFPICTYDRGCAGSEHDSDIQFFLCICDCGPSALSLGRRGGCKFAARYAILFFASFTC